MFDKQEFDTSHLNSTQIQLNTQPTVNSRSILANLHESNRKYIQSPEFICLKRLDGGRSVDENNNQTDAERGIRLDNLDNTVDLINLESCCCCCCCDRCDLCDLCDLYDQQNTGDLEEEDCTNSRQEDYKGNLAEREDYTSDQEDYIGDREEVEDNSDEREYNIGDQELKMSATTESSNGTSAKNKTGTKLKPVAAKRSSLDANTVPARKSTSGVYKLINPKRASLDSSTSASSKSVAEQSSSNQSTSDLSNSSPTKSSLLTTPSFDSREKLSSSSSSDHLSANSEPKRKLSIEKKSLNGITEDELNCAFQLLDVNSDGTISKQELKEMLLSLNIQADDHLIDQMILEVTRSDDGMINKDQFKELMINFAKNKDKEDDIDRDLYAAFQVFDRDQNGYLTKDELQLALEMMGEEFTESDINTLMRLTDLDNDGKISFNEFKIRFRTLN